MQDAPWLQYQSPAARAGPTPGGPRTITLGPPDPRRPSEIRRSTAEADAAEAHAVIERAQADAIRQRQAVEAAAARLDPDRTGPAALQGVDPTIAAHVRALTEARIPWPNGRQIVDPHWATVVALAPLYQPGFSAEVYQQRQRAANSYGTGPDAHNITALATVMGHAEHALQGISALNNYSAGSLGPLTGAANALHAGWQHAEGTDAPQSVFAQDAQAVGTELERAWRMSGGAASEIAQWQGRLNVASSPETLRAVLQDGIRLVARRLNEVTQNYQQATNRPGELPPISQDALRILRQYARPEDAPLVFQHLQAAGAASARGNNGVPLPVGHAPPPAPGSPPPAGGAPPPGPGSGPGPGPAPPDGSLPQGVALSTDGTTIATDETLRGLNGRVSQLIREGAASNAPPAEVASRIEDYVRNAGVDPARVNGQIEPWVSFIRANPNYGGTMANFEAHSVPMTGVQSFLNKATNALPSEVPAYLLGTGDVLSGGNLDSLSRNPELTRVGMGQMASENPYSTLAGNVTGFGMLGAGGEAGLARLGMAGGKGIMAARPLLADMASGAYYGAGSDDDNRAEGALFGALSGFGGGVAGRGAGRVVGGVVRGVTDPAAQYLNRIGVPMSLSQMVGRSGPLGRVVGWMGNAMPNIPMSGVPRAAAQRFNSATINEALAPIGADLGNVSGASGAQAMNDAAGGAYQRALGGSSVTTDQPFFSDLTSAAQQLNSVPRVGPEAWDTVRSIVRPQPGSPSYIDAATGNLTGENLQPLLRELGGVRRAYRNDPLANRVGNGVSGVEDAITGIFDRQAPEVMPALNAANTAWRNTDIVNDAMNMAVNKDRLFSPAQLGQSIRQNARYVGGPQAIAEGDTPFYNLQRFGQQVLPSTVPDSGTAGRLALLGGLGTLGAGGGAVGGYANGENLLPSSGEGLGAGLTLAALLMGGHALARPLLQKALLGGSADVRAALGNRLATVPQLWDALGLGVAANRYLAPSPPQVLQP